MLAVVAHDAGGAELLSSYVRQRSLDCLYVLEGPARKVFERKLGLLESLPLEEAVRRSVSVLCGTSWQSDLEFHAIELGRTLGKHVAVFLDHWVNYRERFVRSSEVCLPNEIWVGDVFAYDIAKRTFPDVPIELVENPYFLELKAQLNSGMSPSRIHRQGSPLAVLYVCEPLREHGLLRFGNERHWGYTEEEALRYFLTNTASLGSPVERIVIRQHPSEPNGKYGWVVNEFDLPIVVGSTSTLLDDIADSDVVVGCNSMALVVGLMAAKKVFSCIPPGGVPCSLPQPEIQALQSVIAALGASTSKDLLPNISGSRNERP